MIDSTNPRVMADNIRELSGVSGSQASDISALQTTVEALGSYSTTEVNTGKKWIDNSDIYRKVFYVEALPNSTTENFNHNISDLGIMTSLTGMIPAAADFAGRPLPYSNNALLRYSASVIQIVTTSDLSSRDAYIIAEYTKSASPSPNLAPVPNDTRSIEPEPGVRESEEPVIDEPIEEPVKKTTRKKTTTTE